LKDSETVQPPFAREGGVAAVVIVAEVAKAVNALIVVSVRETDHKVEPSGFQPRQTEIGHRVPR
jgi:hypothetical protein